MSGEAGLSKSFNTYLDNISNIRDTNSLGQSLDSTSVFKNLKRVRFEHCAHDPDGSNSDNEITINNLFKFEQQYN